MRKLRKLSMAVVLAFMLAPSALAGITDTPPAPAPPPSGSAQSVAAPSDPVMDVAISLLQSLLSLF